MAENDIEALAAKLKKTESDLVRIGWLDDADNVREAFTALRSTTAAKDAEIAEVRRSPHNLGNIIFRGEEYVPLEAYKEAMSGWKAANEGAGQ